MVRIRVVAILGVCLLAASAALAEPTSPTGTVKLAYTGVDPAGAAYIWLDYNYSNAYYVGKYNTQLDLSYTPTGEGVDIYAAFPSGAMGTFCADMRQDAYSGWAVYEVYRPADAPIGGANPEDGMGEAKASDLRKLFFNYLYGGDDDVWTPDEAAAFQASVWEIIFEQESTYDVDSASDDKGSFYMSYYWAGSWISMANTWLSALSGYDDPDIGLRVLANDELQDYAITVPGLGGEPIPEPLTMLGVFAGVAGLGGYIRRRRMA